jgi:MFS family permease
LVLIAVATRIAAPMLTLGLLLAIVQSGRSYGSAGAVLTGYATALALMVPVASRLIDRLPPRRILLMLLTFQVVAYTATIVVVTQHAHLAVLVGCAMVLGGSTPPAGALVRGTWPEVVPSERLQAAYALDAVLTEAMFVTGPLVVSGLLLFTTPIVAVAVAGLSMLVGASLLAFTPSVGERQAPRAGGRRDYLGPLAHGQVLVLLFIIICDTFAFGSVLVGVPAAAADAGAGEAAGVLLSIGSLGAVISGLVYGARPRGGSPGKQLALFHAAGAVLLVSSGWAPGLIVFGLILLCIGLVGGPRDTLHGLVLGEAAPARSRTEAFGWMGTFMWAGYAIGTATAGQLVSRADNETGPAFIAAGCGAAVAALLSLLVRPTTPGPAASGTTDDSLEKADVEGKAPESAHAGRDKS